jgi:hypothetical protein
MIRPLVVALSVLLPAAGGAPENAHVGAAVELSYTADGQMNFPENYREWVYLTSGLGMSYSASPPDHAMFDNVFVNPAAYKAFLQTGTWPDKTVLVLEVRGADSKVSIDHHGQSQTPEVMGIEVHVRDEKLPGKWGFFEFDPGAKTGKIVPRPASCYTCHEQHGAVDTTFVQFYPTLIGLAKQKKTLSAAYLKEMPGAAGPTH